MQLINCSLVVVFQSWKTVVTQEGLFLLCVYKGMENTGFYEIYVPLENELSNESFAVTRL